MREMKNLLHMQQKQKISQDTGYIMEYKHKMMDYSSFPIFHDINEGSLTRMMACFRVRQSVYEPGAVVREYDGNRREVGIVTEGAADLVRIDYGGTRTILEHLEVGSIFGEVLAFTVQTGDSISVVTDSGCRVMYMDYDHIMKRCENACQHHSQLVQNLFSLVTDQMQQMGQRVEVLSRRSIREKLLCYFSIQARDGAFTLPFTLSALADYIGSDRSAMMRELRKLRQEGLVQVEGRRVTLPPHPQAG